MTPNSSQADTIATAYRSGEDRADNFRHLVTQAPIGITILKGEDLIIEIANNNYLQLIDKTEDEVVGRKLFDVLPETRAMIENILMDVIRKGQPYYGNEFKVNLRRGGAVRPAYFNFVYQPLRETDGSVSGVIVVAYDVTEQIELREAQLEAEKQFRRMVMDSPVAMTIWRGPEFIIEVANKAMYNNIWRKEEKDIIGKKALEVFPELNDQKYPDLLRKVMRTGLPHRQNEALAYVQGDDGMKKFYLDFEYAPLFHPDRSVSGLMITVSDVTERVVARQQLEDAEARLRLAAEGTGLATWDLDLVSGIVIHSPRLVEIFGHDRSVIMTKDALRAQMHADDRKEIVERAFENAMKSGVYYYEARIVRPDNSIRWIHTHGRVIFDEDHKPVRMLGTLNDVTEQKLASTALAESEQRLNIAQEATGLGTWELNMQNGTGVYSARYLQLLGLNEDERPTHQQLLERIHPDDRAARDAAMKLALATGVFDIEMRIFKDVKSVLGNKTADRDVRWIRARGKMFYDRKGNAERLMGTMMDITEQKNAFTTLLESEERFKTVADGAPVMIWMSGSDKFLDFFNTTWLNFTGRSIEEERGEGWLENVHPADKALCVKIYTQAYEKQKPFHTEYRLRRYDGVYRWISDNAVPRYTVDGKFVGFISACMDIDDEKRINQRLQASELLFKTISNVSPVGLWMTNDKGENNFVNGTWIDWTGIPLTEQYGPGWLKPLLDEDKERVFASYLTSAANREKFSAEFRFRRADGDIRWALSEGFPYFDSEGNFAGYAGSVSDITERKQDELRKNDFLAVASHELKTPITSIKAYTQLLANTYQKTGDPLLKNALSKIENQVNKMSKLVSDFLNLSKIESDKFQMARDRFSLRELVEEAVADLRLVSPAHSITADTGDDPAYINGDEEKIMQVLTNLMNNAVKYSPDDKQVEIALTVADGEAMVSVKDRGIGIKPAEFEKIFQRFYRADSNNIQVSGFGIGLYIAAEIIRIHGGQIGVQQNEQKGSCFYFKLPLAD